jgi:flagellar hook-length control protein FliK
VQVAPVQVVAVQAAPVQVAPPVQAAAVQAAPVLAATADGLVPKPPAEAQPPGAAAPQGVEISVVRSVGNANQSQSAGDGAQAGVNHGQKQEAASTTPEAQAASSAAVMTPPAAASPTAEVAPQTQVHTTPQPVEQVARAVIDRAEQGGGEVHIRLDPPELGAVSIHVRIDGNRVQIQVQAERSEAMNLLRQGTNDLTSLLGSRGLNLTDVNVGFGGQQAQGRDQSASGQPAAAPNGEFASILGIDETPATGLHNRLQSAYNPDGVHLYRV